MTDKYLWIAVCQEFCEQFKVTKTIAPWLAAYAKKYIEIPNPSLAQIIRFIIGEFDETKLNKWGNALIILRTTNWLYGHETFIRNLKNKAAGLEIGDFLAG